MKINLGEKRSMAMNMPKETSITEKIRYPRMSFTTPKPTELEVGGKCCIEVTGVVAGISKKWDDKSYVTEIEMHSIEMDDDADKGKQEKSSTRVDHNEEAKY